jgi:hypothetical protein
MVEPSTSVNGTNVPELDEYASTSPSGVVKKFCEGLLVCTACKASYR